jgi:hypothetical protein
MNTRLLLGLTLSFAITGVVATPRPGHDEIMASAGGPT